MGKSIVSRRGQRRVVSTGKRIARLIIGFLLILIFALGGIWLYIQPRPNNNTLAIGELAQTDSVTVEIVPSIELDFMSKAEVFELRENAVQQYPMLIDGDYSPSDAVFGQIESDIPWWGTEGQFHFMYTRENGKNSIAGTSEEARFILNPFLLVATSIYYIEARDQNGDEWWHPGLYAEQIGQVDAASVLSCEPRQVEWQPQIARAEVLYDVQGCLNQMSAPFDDSYTFSVAYFSLIAYNARDLNLNYLYVDYEQSEQIALVEEDVAPQIVAIPHYIHRGGSCGYPGGCNNMSPSSVHLDRFELSSLPATATIYLWKNQPTSTEIIPDFTYVILFR